MYATYSVMKVPFQQIPHPLYFFIRLDVAQSLLPLRWLRQQRDRQTTKDNVGHQQ